MRMEPRSLEVGYGLDSEKSSIVAGGSFLADRCWQIVAGRSVLASGESSGDGLPESLIIITEGKDRGPIRSL